MVFDKTSVGELLKKFIRDNKKELIIKVNGKVLEFTNFSFNGTQVEFMAPLTQEPNATASLLNMRVDDGICESTYRNATLSFTVRWHVEPDDEMPREVIESIQDNTIFIRN